MSISLAAVNSDSDAHKHLDFSWKTGNLIFDLCGAPFHQDVGETSAAQALHYAAELRREILADDEEFKRVYELEDRDDDIEGAREPVAEFATFCEHCGGYTMWV